MTTILDLVLIYKKVLSYMYVLSLIPFPCKRDGSVLLSNAHFVGIILAELRVPTPVLQVDNMQFPWGKFVTRQYHPMKY